jgi:hypothetical protein
VGLSNFKAKWSEESTQKWIKEEDSILKETNDEIRNLFYLMKRKCGDYLYRANLVWENLVNSKVRDIDSWFNQYAKVSREFHNEIWENCFICARDTIYMMRNGNFRNNQMLMDLYIMGVEAMINMDNVDESFMNEGMMIGIEIPGLAVRKLYYDILVFSRTDRRILTNDTIEYKENRTWIYKCYKLWLKVVHSLLTISLSFLHLLELS